MKKPSITFSEKIWIYPGEAAWHFVTLPQDDAFFIKENFGHESRGWGSLKVEIQLGSSSWKTSIFPDKKLNSYVLPLKKDIRKKENLHEGDSPKITITIQSSR